MTLTPPPIPHGPLNPPNRKPQPHVHVPDAWTPINLIAASLQPPTPPSLVEARGGGALLYHGKPHVISGPPEALKSWLAVIAAAETMYAGHHVIWVDTDGQGPASTLERLRALLVPDDLTATQFHYIVPDEPITRDGVKALQTRINPRLVVIDAFNPSMVLHNLSPNSGEDVEKFVALLVRSWEDTTVVLIDHVVKNPENRGAYSIGSERKLGFIDVHLGLDVKERMSRDKAGRAAIYAHKDRPGWHNRMAGNYIGEIRLEPSPAGLAYTITLGNPRAGEGDGPTNAMQDISMILERSPTALSKTQIEQVANYRAETVRWALDVLTRNGFVDTQPGPRNSVLHTSVRAYRNPVTP